MAGEAAKKGQFVEVDFTARIKQTGEVFDTTLSEEAKRAKLPAERVKSFIVCIGEGMVLSGFDRALDGKEVGKQYSISLAPKEAFGERNPKMIKIVPLKFFQAKGVMPYPGLTLNMDGLIARISAVSGGRVITDFNNPLSGKDILYDFRIKRVIEDTKEKLSSLIETFLHEDANKAIKTFDGKAALIRTEKKMPLEFFAEISKRMNALTGLTVTIESDK